MDRFLQRKNPQFAPINNGTYWLKSFNRETHKDVEILGKTEVGRSKYTEICDNFCSKIQLLVEIDPSDKEILLIEVVGTNPSGFNGFMVEKGRTIEARHNDIIDILYGRYQYKIEAIPPRNSNDNVDQNDEDGNSNLGLKWNGNWDFIDNNKLIVFTAEDAKPSNKIASFDLDWTIIKTKSGNVFPKSPSDWEIMLPEIPGKLKSLIKDSYKICLFTNQSGISKGKFSSGDFKFRVNSILEKLKIPTQVFIATGLSVYRKPVCGMWEYLQDHMNGGVLIDKENSFYVGDAAGRPEMTLPVKRKRDHSCVDRLFAMNIGIKFYTPEQYFQGKKPMEWVRPTFCPNEFNNKKIKLYESDDVKISKDKLELIVMVGLPGSGKSFFTKKHLQSLGYVILNADTLGSTQACLKQAEKCLSNKNSCVIDNTNVDVESRKKYVNLAENLTIPCRCFIMNTSLEHIQHNLIYRQLTDEKHSKINDMILNTLKKKFVEPSLTEGFKDIVKINFCCEFDDPDEEKLYKMFLVNK